MATGVPALLLAEGVEGGRHERLRDPDAGVAHPQDGLVAFALDGHPHAAALGELDGVGQQVARDPAQRRGVHGGGHVGRGVDVEPQALVERDPAVGRRGLLDRPGQAQRDGRGAVLAGVELGQVEDGVEGVEQAAAVALDVGHEVALLLRHLGREQVGEAQDARERRPDLVAHVGQERALKLVQALGGLPAVLGGQPGLDQGGLVPLARGHVLPRVVHHDGAVVGGRPHAGVVVDPARLARLGPDLDLAPGLAVRAPVGRHRADGLDGVGVDERLERLDGRELGDGVAADAGAGAGRPLHAFGVAVALDGRQRVVARHLGQGLVPLLGGRERPGRLLVVLALERHRDRVGDGGGELGLGRVPVVRLVVVEPPPAPSPGRRGGSGATSSDRSP